MVKVLRKNDFGLSGPFLAQGHHQKWTLWLNLVKVQEPFSIFSLLLYYFLSFTVLVSLIVLTLTHTHTSGGALEPKMVQTDQNHFFSAL